MEKKEIVSNTHFLVGILAFMLFIMLVMMFMLYEFMLKTGLISLLKTH